MKGGKAVRTHPLDVHNKPSIKDKILDYQFQLFTIAVLVAVLAEVGVYFALGVDPGLWIALSFIALLVAILYGHFWLAGLIVLWWLWMS